MRATHLLTAATAALLISGAAYAQEQSNTMADPATPEAATPPVDSASPTGAMPPAAGSEASTTMSTDTTAAPAASAATDTSATTPAGTVTVSTVTNGPVPDTPENRAMYKPLSRAGKATAARGN